jgi:hypothetical protein
MLALRLCVSSVCITLSLSRRPCVHNFDIVSCDDG